MGILCDPEPLAQGYSRQPYVPLFHYEIPQCAKNTTKLWCLQDSEYPSLEIQKALQQHYITIKSLYKNIFIDTSNSVDGLDKLSDETYLCPSTTGYIQPLRAVNIDGKWRTIVNGIESYGVKYMQNGRIEECDVVVGTTCPLVSSCYQSKCVQKNIYHRFLVFDPYDYTFPFAIEKFKLPASCACVVGAFGL